MMAKKYSKVITIAGSDSGGGAGIQADLKTLAALGCYGMSVITALTAQNTKGITAINAIPTPFVIAQLEADKNGVIRVEKPGDTIDEEKGVSVRGTTVQLGLTDDEIEDVWERLEDLLKDIDDGKIGVF